MLRPPASMWLEECLLRLLLGDPTGAGARDIHIARPGAHHDQEWPAGWAKLACRAVWCEEQAGKGNLYEAFPSASSMTLEGFRPFGLRPQPMTRWQCHCRHACKGARRWPLGSRSCCAGARSCPSSRRRSRRRSPWPARTPSSARCAPTALWLEPESGKLGFTDTK